MRKNILLRLKRIDHLISIKGTGNPAELAARLKMSERNLYQYIKLMKDLGAPIRFDRYRETYYYHEDGQFIISFQSKAVERPAPLSPLTSDKVEAC